MKQAILIQCHNNPIIINSLIDFFPTDSFDFFIHIDRKSNIRIEKRENVFLVNNRVDVRWGQFSEVEATYALIYSINTPDKYSYCHFISGSDFPVKSVDWFLKKYTEDNVNEYIQSNYLDGTSTWSWGGLDRFQCWYPQWMIHRPQENKFMRLVRVLYREFIMRTKIFKRKNQPVIKFYGGSQWWTLTGACVNWIKNNTTKEYYNFFKHSVCSDEVYFATLVRYSPYSDNIINKPARFMNWDEPGNNSGGPAIIKVSEIDSLIKSEYPFARKIVDPSIVNELINELKK